MYIVHCARMFMTYNISFFPWQDLVRVERGQGARRIPPLRRPIPVQGVGSRDQCELQREEAGLPALHQPSAGRVCRAQEVHRQRVRQLPS
jgi:hypothetical protein